MSAAQSALVAVPAVEAGTRIDGSGSELGSATGVERSVSVEPIDTASLEQRILNPESFLYSELAKSLLGERASVVLSVLINKGRLSTREIRSYLPDLSLSGIKTVLVSLIQLRCVQYLEETAFSGRKTVYYYFNPEGLYIMLYAGDICDNISKCFGDSEDKSLTLVAQQIVHNLLAVGSLTISDYMQSLSGLDTPDHENDQFKVQRAFLRLVETEILIPLQGLHYTPIGDLWNLLYMKEYKKLPKNSVQSDSKKRNEAKAKAKTEFNRIIQSPICNPNSDIFLTDSKTGIKKVNDSMSLTFNLDRFLKLRRSTQLTQFARSRIGTITSQIYSVALAMSEQHSNPLSHPLSKTGLFQDLDERTSLEDDLKIDEENVSGVSFTAIDLAKRLPKNIDLRGSLVHTDRASKRKHNRNPAISQTEKRIKTEDGFVIPALPTVLEESEEEEEDANRIDMLDDDDGTDPHSLALVNGHLRLLLNSSIPFIKESKPGQFFVPYSTLIPALKSSIYDSIIASTLGASSHRVLRCIRDNGLCTERTITTTSLMREKDVRTVLGTLVKYNAIEIQEVPRTADRAASRAVFLFRVNEMHAFNTMKQNLTWNLATIISKIELLKQENSTLLKKANRDDVKGRELELLLTSEINQLKVVNDREANGTIRRHRLLSLWEIFEFF